MMNGFPSKETVERIRKQYPVGCLVKLVSMSDAFAPPVGTTGRVTGVDDCATVHIIWSNGSSLGAVFQEDIIEKVEP